MEGVKDRLSDLSWLGIENQAWFEVEVPDPVIDQKAIVDQQIAKELADTVQMVALDNLSLTKGQLADWMSYRQLVKEIPLQPDYPNSVIWPIKPE